MKINRNAVKKAMRKFVEDCRDPRTGELNYTMMAEQTADELDLYIDKIRYEIPEEVFDIACEFE